MANIFLSSSNEDALAHESTTEVPKHVSCRVTRESMAAECILRARTLNINRHNRLKNETWLCESPAGGFVTMNVYLCRSHTDMARRFYCAYVSGNWFNFEDFFVHMFWSWVWVDLCIIWCARLTLDFVLANYECMARLVSRMILDCIYVIENCVDVVSMRCLRHLNWICECGVFVMRGGTYIFNILSVNIVSSMLQLNMYNIKEL